MSNPTTNLKLDKRNKAILLNDCVKIITQASWDLKIISQQYPIQSLDEDTYEEYISAIEDQVVSFSQAVAKMAIILNR
jgi:hypothetical protein